VRLRRHAEHRRPLIVGSSGIAVGKADGVAVSVEDVESGVLDGLLAQGQPTTAFFYVVLSAAPKEKQHLLLNMLPPNSVVASSDPTVLSAVWNDGKLREDLWLSFRASCEKDVWDVPPCPFSGVEMGLDLASPAAIQRVHNYGKEVYVRVDRSASNAAKRRHGIEWLSHEGVDLVIYEAQ
jgi:hypothetical protein